MKNRGKFSTTMRIEIPPEGLEPAPETMRLTPTVRRKPVPASRPPEQAAFQPLGEADFQELFQNVYDGVVITDLYGRIVDANRRAEKFLQYAREVLSGHGVVDFISGADASLLREIHESLESDRFVLIQASCRRSDGSLFPAEISVNRISLYGADYLCFFVRDITIRKESEMLLRVGSNAIHNAGTGIVITDLAGVIEYLNPAMVTVLGVADDEAALGLCIADYFPEQTLLGEILDTVHKGRHWVGTFRLVNAAERNLHVQVSAAANFDEDDDMQGMVFSFLDITENKRAEERNLRLMQELSRSNEDLERFAYVVSHDLQEPLRKISTFSGMLKRAVEQGDQNKSADLIERVQASALRMQDLIRALLDLSRVSTRAQPFVEIDLGALVAETLGDLEWAIQKAKATVEVDDLPIMNGEPVQMRQLVQNLVCNALKFRKTGVPVHVRVSSREAPTGLDGEPRFDLLIEDNGIGFEDKHCERIFEVFQRLHRRDAYEGTGIGLAICRKIAERHGGTIHGEGEPGKGATFIVNLPFRPVAIQDRDRREARDVAAGDD